MRFVVLLTSFLSGLEMPCWCSVRYGCSAMSAKLHGGSLGRWFEELCRIKDDHDPLQNLVASTGARLMSGCLPTQGGVYAFWWTGDRQLLASSTRNRELALKGPGGRTVCLDLDDEWLGLSTDLPIPLYVGKSASGIQKRVGQHLMLSRERVLRLGRRKRKAKPPTTSCQLRAGIEHFFPSEKDTRAIVLKNVGLSYVALDGDENAVNRFYLEDLAIGLMRPPLNVDIER